MQKGLFSKLVVIFCLIEMTIMQCWSMYIAKKTGIFVTSLLTVNHSVFGGELLLLCMKRIFTDK